MSGADVTDLAAGRSWAGAELIGATLDHRSRFRWWIAFLAAFALLGLLGACVSWLAIEGVGVWGNNIPVTWALDIVGYDWWIGVASGSLLLSAILTLARAELAGAISRLAETVALSGAVAAGLYPIIHLGRPWFFYWNLPYPNTFLLWPQFRSPLTWDAIALLAYLPICGCFWFTGLLPDLAAMRDGALDRAVAEGGRPGAWLRELRAQLYGIAALGWRGSVAHWMRWQHAHRALACLAVVIVISIQTGAAVMFAGSVEPGWHDALLPVTYLVSASLSGVAVVGMLSVLMGWAFRLGTLASRRHYTMLAAAMLGLAMAQTYCFAVPALTSVLTGSEFDRAATARRFAGPHAWSTWALILGAMVTPQVFWVGPLRRSALALFGIGGCVAFGVWADHFMVIVTTLQRDFLPSSSHPFFVDVVGIATFVGTLGLFGFIMLAAARFIPIVSVVGMHERMVDHAADD